jgi:hypothetical protein
VPTILTLPWRWTRRARPDRTVLFASRFDAVGIKDRWRLFIGGARLRNAVMASPGALGVSLRAHLLAGRFYTLSMWEDEGSLLAFARSEGHRSAVRGIAELGPPRGVLVSRNATSERPNWKGTLHWVAGAEPGPYQHEGRASGTELGGLAVIADELAPLPDYQ